jgi:hypothetical protein
MSDVYELCLARKTTPYSSWPAVCVLAKDHDGEHQGWPERHHNPGTGETWPR